MPETLSEPMELTVGELAARSGVSVSALHFYERQNLIHSRRTGGNQRRYGDDVLRRVALIRIATRVGIPLSSIAAALALLPEGIAPSRQAWERLTHCWKADLDDRISKLEQLRDVFDDCIGCGCMSVDRCVLVNSDDESTPRRLRS